MSTVEKPSLAVADYDPWNCAVNDNPFPYYAALRREAPVHHVVNRGMWVISRHDDVQRALADTEAFAPSGTGLVPAVREVLPRPVHHPADQRPHRRAH
ncbi:MAG TPA: hypothetical protein VGH89_34945 [Pseudonocardia sp.]|jgi:cytochrome P450